MVTGDKQGVIDAIVHAIWVQSSVAACNFLLYALVPSWILPSKKSFLEALCSLLCYCKIGDSYQNVDEK